MAKVRVIPGSVCADKSGCTQTQVGKSKYCRTHRAESRARFKQNVARWHAEAAPKREAKRQAEIAELEARLAALKA